MAKHVIFLGAGASVASGYPDANKLRLLMSSRHHFEDYLQKWHKNYEGDHRNVAAIDEIFGSNLKREIALFREGGFATVDEFCRLASNSGLDSSHESVNRMRSWVGSVLSIRNPEVEFENSDYYGFVQKLFTDSLCDLRDDLAILSFNYDVYLEFLLHRAIIQRNLIRDRNLDERALNIATGGFLQPTNLEWFDLKGFTYLKLHGSIAYPHKFPQLFDEAHGSRLYDALRPSLDQPPPIIFPWEVVDKDGDFLPKKDFPLHGEQSLFKFFQAVWTRAQREVMSAEKISFVGISMHPFMNEAFRFLFKAKKEASIVVANKAEGNNIGFISPNPVTPAGRLNRLLYSIDFKVGPMTILNSFKSFIDEQMWA